MKEDLKWLAENVHKWNLSGRLKICAHKHTDGSFFSSWVYPDEEGYTRAQWQAARDELAKQKQWRGPEDGSPPAGTECEVRYFGKYNNNWLRIKITAVTDTFVIGYIREDWESCIKKSDPYVCFRPVRTEEDKAIEDLTDILCQASVGFISQEGSLAHEIASAIHQAGYRKQEPQHETH